MVMKYSCWQLNLTDYADRDQQEQANVLVKVVLKWCILFKYAACLQEEKFFYIKQNALMAGQLQ
jgi:hypothetical protein